MVYITDTVWNFVWNEEFWLPGNISWKDLENSLDDMYHADTKHLIHAIYVGVIIQILRVIYERFIAKPVGLVFIKEVVRRKAEKNDVLENMYRKNKRPKDNIIEVKLEFFLTNSQEFLKSRNLFHTGQGYNISDADEGLTKQTDMSDRQIQRWFRIRRNQDKSGTLKKFTESSWRFLFYSLLFITGVIVLWDEPWFTDSTQFFLGYPHHHVPNDIYWYYMTELGFYLSLLFSQFMDVKRKDFWEMFIHHVVTISLMVFSWINNYVRIGTIVLVIHDCCDPFLELAKIGFYAKLPNLANSAFGAFTVLWFITRMFLFPYRCVWSTMFYGHTVLGMYAGYYLYNTLLVSLYLLHVIWSVFILKTAVTALQAGGKLQKDERSTDEESVSEDSEDRNKMRNGCRNGPVLNNLK